MLSLYLSIMCGLRVLISSNRTVQKIKNFGNHTIETKLLHILTKSNYIKTISLLVMVFKISNFLKNPMEIGFSNFKFVSFQIVALVEFKIGILARQRRSSINHWSKLIPKCLRILKIFDLEKWQNFDIGDIFWMLVLATNVKR